MSQKLNVGILCGGKSAEHEISLLSATNILAALPQKRYRAVLIGIDRTGMFLFFPNRRCIENADDPKKIRLAKHGRPMTFALDGSGRLFLINEKKFGPRIDVVFPVLHGTYGEDGTIQGLCEIAGIPYVGSDVLGSAIGIDKDITKRLLKEAGVPVANFIVLRQNQQKTIGFDTVTRKLGCPFFVKPATAGSSVGVQKVASVKQFRQAVNHAFRYSEKILFETMMRGREIEVSVLGNEHPMISVPGEIIPHHEFYSYEAKYLDENGAELLAPTLLKPKEQRTIQSTAMQAYRTLECVGMARVDGFLLKTGMFVVSEINTIPGFTNISMYPKLWEASGLPYPKLIDMLIQLAMKRKKKAEHILFLR